jgi:hypothetical protein
MGRKRSPGLRNRGGNWHIEKQVLGQKIHESTGTSDLEEAELILARRIEEIRQAKVFGVRPKRIFREAATKFLEEKNMHLASIGDYAMHLKQLDPYIGELPLEHVHLGTLQPFIEARRKQGIKTKSINNSSWKRVRKEVDLPQVRVRDLKHTFGRRLRTAGVPLETRKVLLGHRNGDITTHYSAPELEELLEAANSICEKQSGKTPALVVLKQKR